MIMLLAPGLYSVGPALVQAAVRPAEPAPAVNVFDAAGTGIGCQAGTRKYTGPKAPKDPPWPPGAEPTPSAEPLTDRPAEADGANAAGPMMLLAAEFATELAAEVDPAANSDDDDDADITPDVETSEELQRQARESNLISGIDVSHHNGDIDYAKVRKVGNEFVFIKATQDDEFLDPMFLTNLARAREAGLVAGGYHFFDYTLDGTAQADHFVDRLELAGGIDDALPPVVDVECWAPIGASIHALSAARLRDFVERVYERTARLPIIYTSVFMWKEVVGNAEGFEDHPLWAACWGCDAPPSIAPGWEDWAFWQTGINRIPGVGRLDGNYFSGSFDDLHSLRLRPLTIEAGAMATSRQEVELDLGGRAATHVRTSADGETWSGWSPVRSAPRAMLGLQEGVQTLYVQLRNGPRSKSPVYRDSITLDRQGPEVSTPLIRLREGPLGDDPTSVPIEVLWEAVDAEAGLADASVTVACDQGRPIRSEAPGSAPPGELTPWSAAAAILPSAICEVTVISRDGAGNVTRVTSDAIEATARPTGGGAFPTAMVEGDQVGIVAQRGPDGGRAAVLIDGQPVDLIDLYAPEPGGTEVVYIAELGPSAVRSIMVEPTGTSDPASSGSVVVIDGFVTLLPAG